MYTLEFENTQGISLQYATANVAERAVSFLIDLAILVFTIIIVMNLVGSSVSSATVLEVAILAPIFIFYALLMEIFNDGRSLGKMIMGLKVIRIDGRYPNTYDYLMRWMFRWVDIYLTLGALAALTVGGTPRNQRVGDILADTTVIRTRNLRVPLERIFSLSKLAEQKITYPMVKELSEEQVILIRETLKHYNKYKNFAHKQAVEELSDRLKAILNVENVTNPMVFLNTIVRDYVSLTR